MARVLCLIALFFASLALPTSDAFAFVPKMSPWQCAGKDFGSVDAACGTCFKGNWNGQYEMDSGGNGAYCRDLGGAGFVGFVSRGPLACPANSSPVAGGSECSCNEGFNESFGKCVPPEEDFPGTCDSIAKKFNSRETRDRYFSWDGRAPTTVICSWEEDMPDDPTGVAGYVGSSLKRWGCKVDVSMDIRYGAGKNEDGSTKWRTQGAGWMRSGPGSACDLTKEGTGDGQSQDEDGKEESTDGDATRGDGDKENCTRGYPGEVNGQKVCVPLAGNLDVTTEENRDEVTRTTGTDGHETTTVTTTNTSCKGEKCTTTTTTGDTDGNTNTHVVEQSRDVFCAKNPRSSICGNHFDPSGEGRGDRDGLGGGTGGDGGGRGGGGGGDGDGEPSSFGGSCASGFQCTGDAIQCAIARDQHMRACQVVDATNQETALYEQAKGIQGNTTGDNPLNETIAASVSVDQTDVIGGGAGVQDLTVEVMGQSITLPFSILNPYLEILGQVLVAVSLLLAFRIVARG